MAETQSAPSLRELSEAVPQCEWKASGRYIGTANHMSLIGECRDENGNWSDTKTSKAKAAFVARLASDYFASRLIDPTTLSEAVAAARAEGVREGLERAADEVEMIAQSWEGDGRSYAMTVAAILRIEEQTDVPPADEETTHLVNRAWERFKAGITPPTTPGGRTDG